MHWHLQRSPPNVSTMLANLPLLVYFGLLQELYVNIRPSLNKLAIFFPLEGQMLRPVEIESLCSHRLANTINMPLSVVSHRVLVWFRRVVRDDMRMVSRLQCLLHYGSYASSSKPSPTLCPPALKFFPSMRAERVSFTPWQWERIWDVKRLINN